MSQNGLILVAQSNLRVKSRHFDAQNDTQIFTCHYI